MEPSRNPPTPAADSSLTWAILDTPVGPVSVGVDGKAVRRVRFGPVDAAGPARGMLAEALAQLRDYLAGVRTEFDLPLVVTGGSEFERAIWDELRNIPHGATRTYGELAAGHGGPGAARAVGTACNRNPLPVIIPCHRVVGAGGKLVGFGAGLPRKRWLLEHEAAVALQRAWS